MGSIPGRGTKILHAVQCGKKKPKKTTAWFFHVGVDIDGCNETSLISHLSDSMYYFRCALSLFFLIQRVILRHNILSFYYIL